MNKLYDNRAGVTLGMGAKELYPIMSTTPARPKSHLEQAIANLTQLTGPLDNVLNDLFARLSPVLRNEEESCDKDCGDPRQAWVKHANDIQSFTDNLERQIKRIQYITSRLEV